MMGPYCDYCGRRCFVVRRLPFKNETILLATCVAGKAHDREVCGGVDADSAINPFPALNVNVAPDPVRDLERARNIAVLLEGEVDRLQDRAARAQAKLAQLCSCGDRPVGAVGMSYDDLPTGPCLACEGYAILAGQRDPAPVPA